MPTFSIKFKKQTTEKINIELDFPLYLDHSGGSDDKFERSEEDFKYFLNLLKKSIEAA